MRQFTRFPLCDVPNASFLRSFFLVSNFTGFGKRIWCIDHFAYAFVIFDKKGEKALEQIAAAELIRIEKLLAHPLRILVSFKSANYELQFRSVQARARFFEVVAA